MRKFSLYKFLFLIVIFTFLINYIAPVYINASKISSNGLPILKVVPEEGSEVVRPDKAQGVTIKVTAQGNSEIAAVNVTTDKLKESKEIYGNWFESSINLSWAEAINAGDSKNDGIQKDIPGAYDEEIPASDGEIKDISIQVNEIPKSVTQLDTNKFKVADLSALQLPNNTEYANILIDSEIWAKGQVKKAIKNINTYGLKNKILDVCKEAGMEMDPYLVTAIMVTESGANPENITGRFVGLMQTPRSVTNVKDYSQQIRAGIGIYKQKLVAINCENDVLAIVSYNSGESIINGVKGYYYAPFLKTEGLNKGFADLFEYIPAFVDAMVKKSGWRVEKNKEIKTFYPRVFYSYRYLVEENLFGDISSYPSSMLKTYSVALDKHIQVEQIYKAISEKTLQFAFQENLILLECAKNDNTFYSFESMVHLQ